MNTIKIVVGDWSDDGHGKTDSFVYQSSATEEEMKEAYNKTCKVLGFDPCKTYFRGYEESSMPNTDYEKIVKLLGSEFGDEAFCEDGEPEAREFSSNELAALWIEMVKYSLPDIEIKEMEDDISQINIGGYGLFWG